MAIQFLNTVAVDTNVLYVDTTNNRVGVGTTNPLRLFHIDSGQNNTAWFRLQGGGGFGRYTDIYNNDDDFLIRADATGGASSIGTINFAIGSDDGVQIGGSGQVTFWQYGSGTFTGTAAKNLAVDSSGNIIETTPVTSNTYDLSGYGTNNGTAGVQLVGSDSSTDQVAITGAGTTSVTRSGSTITVTSNDQYTGTVTGSGTASVTGGQIPYWNSTTNITGTSQLNYSSLAGTGVVGIGNSSTSFIGSRLVVGSGSGSSLMTLYSGSNNTSTIAFANGTSGNAQYRGQVRYNQQNDNLEFLTNGETFSRVYVDSASDLNLVERTLNFRNSFPYAVGAYVDLPTNNQLSIGTNGSERMRITSTGNVGIGTTNPAELLTVSASDDVSIRINSTKNGTWTGGQKLGALEFFGNDGSGEGAGLKGYVNLLSKNQYGAGFDMTFGTTDGTNGISERMRISHNGNVGIGANIPNEKLDVRGKVYIESQGVDWNEATPGLARGAMHFDPVGNGSNNTGNAITFGASDASAGTNAHAGIYTRSDGTYGTKMYFATTDQYATGSKTRMMIDYNGNVGIGTASPIEKLEVVGNAILDNSNAKLKIKAGGTGTVGSIDFTFNTDSTQYGLIDLNYNSRATQGFRIKSLYPLTLDAVINQKFLISGSEKMLINSSGNVGIGTGGNVDERLHIQGSVDNDDIALKIENTFDNNSSANPPSAAVLFQTASNNGHIRVFGAPADTAANHRMDIGATASTSYLTFSPSNTEKMRIASSGKVGIGTTNPDGLLHVSSGTSGDAVVIIESDTDNSNENDNPHVELRQDGGGIKAKLGIEGNAGNTYSNSLSNATYLGTVFQQSLQFITGNTGNVQTAKMTIQPNTGNVGIGTTNPLAKLQVNGGIQLANDTSSPSLYKAGTFRYRTSGNNSYVDMCMQTGASTYAWVNIVTNSW